MMKPLTTIAIYTVHLFNKQDVDNQTYFHKLLQTLTGMYLHNQLLMFCQINIATRKLLEKMCKKIGLTGPQFYASYCGYADDVFGVFHSLESVDIL